MYTTSTLSSRRLFKENFIDLATNKSPPLPKSHTQEKNLNSQGSEKEGKKKGSKIEGENHDPIVFSFSFSFSGDWFFFCGGRGETVSTDWPRDFMGWKGEAVVLSRGSLVGERE